MNREAIVSALFSLVSNAAPFVTAGRRLKLWGDVPPSDKPALFLVERGDTYARASEAVPEVVTMQLEIYIYTDAGDDPTVVPASTLNPLLDAVDTALAPGKLTGLQTLGGLVSHCWIEGKLMKDAGDLDGDGVAVIPVRILVPRG
jgi:hypothetical protein